MFRPLAAVLSAVALLAPAVRAADDDPKAVVARAIKAHGGDALKKFQAARSKSKGKLTIPALGEVEITQETAMMLPDKFREDLEFSVGGQKVSVSTRGNGDEFAIEANGKAVEITDSIKAALKDARHMMTVARLTKLPGDAKYELSTAGEGTVEGKTVVGVRVACKGEKDVNLYFDKETGLLTKIERRTVESMSGNEITEERIVAEYQKTPEGLPMPKKVVVKHDGKSFLEAEVLEVKVLEKIDESEFKK